MDSTASIRFCWCVPSPLPCPLRPDTNAEALLCRFNHMVNISPRFPIENKTAAFVPQTQAHEKRYVPPKQQHNYKQQAVCVPHCQTHEQQPLRYHPSPRSAIPNTQTTTSAIRAASKNVQCCASEQAAATDTAMTASLQQAAREQEAISGAPSQNHKARQAKLLQRLLLVFLFESDVLLARGRPVHVLYACRLTIDSPLHRSINTCNTYIRTHTTHLYSQNATVHLYY